MVATSDLFPDHAKHDLTRPLSEVRDDAERAQIIAVLDRTQGQIGEAVARVAHDAVGKDAETGALTPPCTFGNPTAGKTVTI